VETQKVVVVLPLIPKQNTNNMDLSYTKHGIICGQDVTTPRFHNIKTGGVEESQCVMNGRMISKHFMTMFHNFHTLVKMVIPLTALIMMGIMNRVMFGGQRDLNKHTTEGVVSVG
jgi:hypothetical protein